ncbi:hypothetical protein GGR56DRAFT_650469 [Xylariaceae sp. FL0804]|nr:hypothetical protein GGR56DRAFT_650469 [Xylariaceae sp. FL0804]
MPAEEDFIPIVHQTEPARSRALPVVPAVVMPPIPPTPPTPSDDDGFTPVTPVSSPQRRGFVSRASQLLLPRDALGVAVGLLRGGGSGNRAVDPLGGAGGRGDDDDGFGDTAPLSPTGGGMWGSTGGEKEKQQQQSQPPKRKTLFGVLEGWWDLGLLERGKSLKRRRY